MRTTVAVLCLATIGGAAAAQTDPAASPSPQATATPAASPTAAASPVPVPPAPQIVLPSATPTPRTTPTRPTTPVPRATEAPLPEASASPSPEATLTPEPTPVEATPVPVATATPEVSPTPDATPTAEPPPLADESASGSYWSVGVAAAVLAVAALLWVLFRRRRPDPVEEAVLSSATPAATPPPPFAPAERARLDLSLRPRRAGLNLLSAISENDIVVRNTGDAPATDVRVAATLTGANPEQDAELTAIFAAPIVRPEVAPFALAVGEERVIASIAALARDAIRPLDAGGRPMFVPVVAVNALYQTAGAAAQAGQAFAVGVERVDSAKLAPLWLDALPRTFNQVAARPLGAVVER